MSVKNLSTVRVSAIVCGLTVVGLGAVLACSEVTTGNGSDTSPPTMTLTAGTSSVDSMLTFTADVKDNLGIKRIHVDATGGVTASTDTVFTSAVTQSSLTLNLSVPRSVPAGTAVTIVGYAVDGAGNRSKPDTLRMAAGNLAAGTVVITSPASGTVVVQGKSIILSLSGTSPVKVVGLGYQTSGSFVAMDSTLLSSPLRDSTAIMATLAIPTPAATGSLVVTPFLLDSLGQRVLGTPITLNVQTATASTTPPTVTFGISSRIEVNDTIHVEATDPVGITYLGFEVRLAPSTSLATPPAPTLADSVVFNGNLISVPKTFPLALRFTKFPDTIYVRAFARDANTPSIRGYAKLANGAIREDTLLVVAGVTRALPFGGSVADALYHPRYDQLFLTNIDRNTVEVFNLPDSSFKTAINVGSRPWGITAWPRDRLGTMGDTLLVANSGGTDISYVNLITHNEVSLIQQQQFPGVGNSWPRYLLPNIVVSTVTTELSPATGLPIQVRHTYDFSDRPQYVAATCRPGIGNLCGDVILTYTTTPTPGQTPPFNSLNGSVRWENLSVMTTNSAVPDSIKSHFFFEHIINVYPQIDTLAVTRYDAVLPTTAPGYAVDLVPPIQQVPHLPQFAGDTAKRFYSVVVNIATLGFRDTTYARNSGNFKRAVFGEGGPLLGSRAVIYTDTSGSVEFQRVTSAGDPIPFPAVDLGVSNYFTISDFIGNTFQRVAGVAMNFDGSLAAIRGDSTYLINGNLRLLGLMPTSPSNSGIDFHPQNAQYSGPPASGLMFAASADASLEVWETCHFQRVAVVPIRDPIIGPIKAALRSNGKLIIFGVTAKGVVIVTLPNTFQAACP